MFQRSDLLLLQSSTHTPEILKTLLRMQRENKYCDFKLVTPYKTINVHKLIILANSPSFMQNHGSLDNIEELHFPEVLPTVLDSVVYFLYTGKLKVNKSEISLLKSFCESEGLKSALELLKDYSDVETLNLTVEQLMESPNSHSKHIFEDESAKTPLHISGQKGKSVAYIMKELEAETEKECSVITKSGRVSKPTSLKVATVLAEKKKTKVKSLISEIKSKEHMLMIQKSKSFRSNDTDSKGKSKAHMLKIQKCLSSKRTYLRRKLLSRHSVYIRHEKRRPSIKNNNKKDSEVTDNQNIYSNLIERQNSSGQNPMEQSEEFDPYLFHSYALSNADTSDNDDGDDNNTDYNDNDDDDDAENDDQYECEIDGENETNGEKNPKEKDGKQQIKQKTKQKERVQYRCPECDKVMRCKRYILKHKAEVHQDKESIKAFKNTTCEICGKIVITFKELARHVINKHGNKDQKNICLVRKETCRSCGLVLQHIADRIRHESRHHGLQNKSRLNVSVQCSHCEKKFAADLNLKFHEFHCHGIAPERNILSYCKVEVSLLASYI